MVLGEFMTLNKSINKASSFAEIKTLLDHPQEEIKVELSFFGGRHFSIKGYFFSASIDNVVRKTFELVEKKNYNFSEEERDDGRFIASKITSFYDEIERQAKKVNFITKFFFWLSNLFNDFIVDMEAEWYMNNTIFEGYTEKQFIDKFGYNPKGIIQGFHGHNPDRWWPPKTLP